MTWPGFNPSLHMYVAMYCNLNLIKNTPNMKKDQPRTITGLAEKDVKSNGWPMPPGFDRFESFGYDELTAKHCYFRCSRPPDVDGITILIKMTRLQNIRLKNSVLQPGHLYQKFWSHQYQEPLSTWNNNVLQWVHQNQNFQTYQNQEALATHLISHPFQQGLF